MFDHKPLKTSQVRELIEKLELFYGCNLDSLKNQKFFISEKKKKVYLSNFDFQELDFKRVSGHGLYFGTFHDGNRFRLSIEGTRFITPKKNFVLIDEDNLKSYVTGENLFKDEVKEVSWQDKCPFLIVRHGDENLGCVNLKDDILISYMPKSRRLDFNKIF